MKRLALALCLLAPLPAAAQAPPPSVTTWTHNGSVMQMLVEAPGKVTVVYAEPRLEMRVEGVFPGMPFMFLEFNPRHPERVKGIAHVYQLGCHTIPYPVQGVGVPSIDGAPTLVLEGAAPVVVNCQTVGWRVDSQNSVLTLIMMRQ